MNKKILMLTLMLLAMLTLAMVPVQAAPKEKLDFELYIEGISVSYGPWGTYHAGPRGTEEANPDPKPLIQRTFHAKEVQFMFLNVRLTIGDETYYFDAMPSITGEWEFLCAGSYTHHYTITQSGITFTGYGYTPATGPGTYELIYGIINPMTGEVIMNGVYYYDSEYTNPTGYTFTAALTIDPTDGSMDGVLISQNNLPFVSTSGAAVYTNEDFDMSSIGNFNWNHNTHAGTFRTLYTLEFEDGDIELLALEKGDAMFNFEGTFVGHGTGELKGVKVTGTTEGHIIGMLPVFDEDGNQVMTPLMQFTVAGTIMGWD